MGEEVDLQEFTPADRTRHREKVRRCLDVFARMLREAAFDTDDPMTGLEVELNLVDEAGDPALKNAEALEAIADPDFQTELGQFNIEINVPPAKLREGGLETFEDNLRRSLNDAETKSAERRRPPGDDRHPADPGRGPHGPAQHQRQPALQAAERADPARPRRGPRDHDQRRPTGSTTTSDSIVPEAACTSTQLHVQTSPDQFASYWNASQAISAIQLAVGANSPYLLGKQLWRETRIPLFEQATDTRSEELKAQGVRPRVWFGERWITSVFDLFEENVRYFSALLPITDDEDPLAVLEAGGTPELPELRLHNGTIYRWNRPVYDVTGPPEARVPHLRVENRVLAAGPTVADTMANAALYFGLVRAPGRERAAAVVADVVQRRRGELPRRRPARHRRPGLLARRRPGPRHRAGAAPAAAAGPARAWSPGASTAPPSTGCSASSSSAACSAPTAPSGSCAQMDRRARPGPLRRAARDPARLPRADAHQRAGPHLDLTRRGSAPGARGSAAGSTALHAGAPGRASCAG